MNRAWLLIPAVSLALVTGCGSGVPGGSGAPSPAPASSAAVNPVELDFDAVGVTDLPLSPTGLDDAGAIDVPPIGAPMETNYLAWAPELAEGRPLVLTAHVSGRGLDGAAVPGAFFDLADAAEGDPVAVTGADGAESAYTVTSVTSVDKDTFPTEVYRPRPEPTLVLITCGGELDRAAGDYHDNIIVEAVATS